MSDQKKDEIPSGAIVNERQLILLLQMFGIHPWSYWDEEPFALADKLSEQEQAAEKLKL